MLCLLASCTGGDDDDTAGLDSGAVDSASGDALRDYVSATCAFYERCDADLQLLYGSGEACVDAYLFAYRGLPEQGALVRGLAEQRACWEGLRTVECPQDTSVFGSVGVLGDVVRACSPPGAEEGQPCGNDVPCAEDLTCSARDIRGCGVCASQCTADLDCARAGPAYCEAGACIPRRPSGEPCEHAAQCQQLDCRNGFCTTVAAEGEACPAGNECDTYLFCVAGLCQAPSGEGEACAAGMHFSCRVPFACYRGSCVAHKPLDNPLSGPCSVLGACIAGTHCDDGECVAAPGLGEPCDGALIDPCGVGSFCNRSGACEAERADGASCERDTECKVAQCVAGLCGPQPSCAPSP